MKKSQDECFLESLVFREPSNPSVSKAALIHAVKSLVIKGLTPIAESDLERPHRPPRDQMLLSFR